MHGNHRPTVSICIPAYNASNVVGDALRSVLSQDHADLEILVLDNHSSDGTGRVVSEIAADDSRVRCIRHPENIGAVRNFNACIASARGDFVMILCADDALKPGCVRILAAALRDHPETVLAACGRVFTDKRLKPQRVLRARSQQTTVPGAQLLRECFVNGNRIGEPSAVMFRRTAAARGFRADYSQAVDLEMWFHLLESGDAILLPEALALIRQHRAQTTQSNIRSGRIVEDKRLLFREYGARLGNSLSTWEKWLWDARMASSVTRAKAAGGESDPAGIPEVFFRTTFLRFLIPLLNVGWRLRVTGTHCRS